MMYSHINTYVLPSYLSIEIRQEGDTKKVYIHSKIHVDKVKELSFSYSSDFTDGYILNDLALYEKIASIYGLKLVTRDRKSVV